MKMLDASLALLLFWEAPTHGMYTPLMYRLVLHYNDDIENN
jgi:hypothetical protein